jgi:hypothetical protein
LFNWGGAPFAPRCGDGVKQTIFVTPRNWSGRGRALRIFKFSQKFPLTKPNDGLLCHRMNTHTTTTTEEKVTAAHAEKFGAAAEKLQAVRGFYEVRGLHNRGLVGDCALVTAHSNAARAVAAAALGSVSTPAKTDAARRNGKKGGRPPKFHV